MANHSKALKRLRHTLIREIQDPGALLDSLELRDKFSGYERSQIMSPPLPCERAEKLIDVMEFSTVEVFQAFMSALRRLKPELTMKLERMLREVGGASESSSQSNSNTSNGHRLREERLVQPVQEQAGRQYQAEPQMYIEEDAGVFGLNGCGPGPADHLSHLSYTCREYLASRLNDHPPERNIFHSFCHALGVENKLIQASARSGNPTGYLLQKYSTRPEATMENLERALAEIGMRNVFEGMLDNYGGN